MIFYFFCLGYTITKEVKILEEKYSDVGNRIYMMRKQRGLTREKLAEMSDISVQFLADIEKGRKNMTVTTLRKVAAALVVSTDYIVNGISECSEYNDEINELLKTLDVKSKSYALDILRIYANAVNSAK